MIEQGSVMFQETMKLQQAVAVTKSSLTHHLQTHLGLHIMQAPLLVDVESGLQDGLNGFEQAVSVHLKAMPKRKIEVVHSLAKWKRHKLYELQAQPSDGILTNMTAIRPDELCLSPTHSSLVDQWDWERVIDASERNILTLQEAVHFIWRSVLNTAMTLRQLHIPVMDLPEKALFIESEDLLKMYPELNAKEREDRICREHGAVFLMGIGAKLSNGFAHDNRAPDYDDWSTHHDGYYGLNGDLLVWHPQLNQALELSSMGIRVNAEALQTQLQQTKATRTPWHDLVLSGKMVDSMGGGIGQSRVCMYLLGQSHIQNVQESVWPETELVTKKTESLLTQQSS